VRADGSALWNLKEGIDMGTVATARANSEELKRWAEQMGEILSKKTFGECGPDLKTSLGDMEQLLGPILEKLVAGYFRTAVTQQAERLPDELACPTCGQPCSPTSGARERTMTTEHGDFAWQEISCHCDRCQRSFFPSADRVED
jgi:hypothetical protein